LLAFGVLSQSLKLLVLSFLILLISFDVTAALSQTQELRTLTDLARLQHTHRDLSICADTSLQSEFEGKLMVNLDSVAYSQDPYGECRGKADLIIVKPYKTAYLNGLRSFGREPISIMDFSLQRTTYGLVSSDKSVIKSLSPR
jgi:hypothetical protein